MRKKSIFMTFLLSFLAMLVIPLVTVAAVYGSFDSVIKKQLESYNAAMLKQAQSVLDERLFNVQRLIYSIGSDPLLLKLLNMGETLDNNDIYNISRQIELLSRHKSRDNFIDDITIILPNSGVIIDQSTKYTPQQYYNMNIAPRDGSDTTNDDFVCWYEDFNRRFYIEPVTSTGDGISFRQSIPIGEPGTLRGVLCVSVNSRSVKNTLDGILRSVNISDEGAVFLSDSQNNILLATGSGDVIKNIGTAELNTGSDAVYKTVTGAKMIISTAHSGFMGFKYVSAVPSEMFSRQLNAVKNTIVLITLLFLAAGVALALVLSSSNAAPVKKIITEKSELNDKIKKQLPVIQDNLLLQLIKGNVWDDMTDDLTQALPEFAHSWFCVFVISVTRLYENTFKEKNLIRFAVKNIMEELSGGCGRVVEADAGKLAFIANVKSPSPETKTELYKIAEVTSQIMCDKLNSGINISIGTIREGLGGIAPSFSEADKVSEYQLMQCVTGIKAYEEINYSQGSYSYPIETELMLLNCVKLGNIKKVTQILEDVFTRNFADGSLSPDMARCLFFDIMNTGIKLLNSGDIDAATVFGMNLLPYDIIISCKNTKEMQEALIKIFGNICDFINENKAKAQLSQSTVTINSVKNYLDKHFQDNSLSLVSVADYFNINPNYLSGLFKEQTGENFMAYVNNLRLDMSKRLLLQTSKHIGEIADDVGYSGSGVLIRNFKKAYGVTPGEYRDTVKNSGSE